MISDFHKICLQHEKGSGTPQPTTTISVTNCYPSVFFLHLYHNRTSEDKWL